MCFSQKHLFKMSFQKVNLVFTAALVSSLANSITARFGGRWECGIVGFGIFVPKLNENGTPKESIGQVPNTAKNKKARGASVPAVICDFYKITGENEAGEFTYKLLDTDVEVALNPKTAERFKEQVAANGFCGMRSSDGVYFTLVLSEALQAPKTEENENETIEANEPAFDLATAKTTAITALPAQFEVTA